MVRLLWDLVSSVDNNNNKRKRRVFFQNPATLFWAHFEFPNIMRKGVRGRHEV